MSLDSLGSLAQTMSDKYLRETFRKIVTGTNMSVTAIMDGFRNASDVNMPSRSSIDTDPQAPPSAFGEMLRGSSYTRNNSDNLKRRNSSMRNTRQGLVGQQSGGQANSLRTIYSSTSMGPVSPRIARKQTGKERTVRMTPRAKRILGLCVAAGLFALCMLSGYFLPLLSGSRTPNILREITPPPRRLLDFTEETVIALPNSSGQLHDAYTARHRHHTETYHASRWDSHMATRMSRQLAEGMAGRTSIGADSTVAEAPNSEISTSGGITRSPPSSTASTSSRSPTWSSEGSHSIESTMPKGSALSTSPASSKTSVGDGSWNLESTTSPAVSTTMVGSVAAESGSAKTAGSASTQGSANSGASVYAQNSASTVGSASTQGSASTDNAASAALTGQFNSYRSIEGVSSGSVGSISGGASSSGVSVLQQAGTESSSNKLATGSGTNTLQYSNGYAEIGGSIYKVLQHTQNADQCASICARDTSCVAWTRVAGGRSDVQSCYLKDSLSGVAGSSEASVSMQQGSQAVNYVDSSKVILESGTRNPTALPSALYGCPYPSTSNGDCKPPASCNCYQGACYGTC